MILKEAPEGAEVLDLEAARAARAEARGSKAAPVLKIAAGYVQVRAEIDIFASEALLNGDVRGGLSLLLADPSDIDEIVKVGLSIQDLEAISALVLGKSLGE